MRFRNKILYISFLLLLSCKNADELSKILLKGDADYLEGSFSEFPMDMYRPAKLYVIGNKLIVFDDVKEELFKVFKIPTLDYCYSFGKKEAVQMSFICLIKKQSMLEMIWKFYIGISFIIIMSQILRF